MNNAVNLKEFIEKISYNKSQTFNRAEILEEISKFPILEVYNGNVKNMPVDEIKTNKIYLELNNKNITNNKYNLYVYTDEGWEQLDKLEFDINNYPTLTQMTEGLNSKAPINHGHDNVTSTTDGFMSKEDKSKLDTINPSDSNPLMDGTVSQGTSTKYSRQDHRHPSDTGKVDVAQSTANMNLVTGSDKKVTLEAKNNHSHGVVNSDGSISNATNKNVVTDNTGKITVEDKYNHPSYTARTGKPTGNQTPSFGDNVTVSQVTSDSNGHVTNMTDRNIKIPDNLGDGTNKGLTSNDYTSVEKSKLADIEEGANNYTHPSYTAKSNGLYKVTVDNTGHVSATNSVTASDLPSHEHDTGSVKDTSAYSNIGSSANSTQKTINNNINTKLGTKANSSDVYTKSQTLTASEITQAIADGVSNVSLFEVVTALPTSNIKGNKFYLISNGESINQNVYDIYIYVNNKWEQIDSLEFDIDNYYTISQVDSLLNGKVNTTDSRLTDTRTPKTHSHGNITNTGAIGTASGKIVTTGTNGVLQASDSISKSQISDFPTSMTPTSHTHGSIQNNGTLNSDITSVNKVVVTDSSNNVKTINKLPLANVTHQDISGKAPTNHKSTATTYGVGDASNYGHVKVDSSMNASSTNPVQNKVVKDYIDEQVGDIVSGDVDLSNTHNHDDRYIKTGTGTVTSTNIADKTIVNGDIADGTIESGKIKDGTIINGDIANTTITGGKLANSTITATQLANNSVTIDKIEFADDIGGTNLLTGTQDFSNGTNGAITTETYNDCTVRRYNNTNGTNYVDCSYNNTPKIGEFKQSDRFTLSFWAKGTGSIICYSYGVSGYLTSKPIKSNGTNSSTYGDGNCTFTLTSDWKRYYVTWELNPSGASSSLNVSKTLLIRTSKGADSYIAGVMFERGEIAHDWSLSPLEITTKINGKANTTHTHHDTDINWNGTALANQVSPVDMAMYEEFNTNRLAYLPGENITVEYSTDGGSTWTDYGASAIEKLKLVTTTQTFNSGKGSTTNYSKNKLRITIDAGTINATTASKVYMMTRKLMIYFCECNATGTKVLIEKAPYTANTTFSTVGTYDVKGWTGWNSIPIYIGFGGYAGQQNSTGKIQKIRLTFTQTGGTGNCNVQKIRLFGETCWIAPSVLANNGHMYSYDESKHVTFPNYVWSQGFVKNQNSTNVLLANGSDIAQSSFIANSTGSVTSNHIADKTIVNGDIADGTIESGKIKDGTIVNGDIANTTITGGKLVNSTVTATQLASNSVETAKIKDGAVTNSKLSATVIPNGTDLNTIKTIGFYAQPTSANTSTMVNLPDDIRRAFTMIVEPFTDGGVTQTLTFWYNASQQPPVKKFVRNGTSSWSEWVELTKDTNTTYSADESTLTKSSSNVFSLKDSSSYVKTSDNRLSNARTPIFNDIAPSSSATKNLNNYTTGGFYYCSNNTNSQYVSNCPLSGTNNRAFFLLVETWGTTSTYVKQTLTYYHNNTTYTRTSDNGSWKSWIELSKDNNTDTHNALEQGTRINVGEAVSANSIVGKVYGDSNGYYKKLVSGLQLDTSYPIFYMPTATSGATNGYQYPYHLKINVNLQTTVSGVTITANKQVFVEGTALDKNKFTVSSKVFVSEGSFTTNYYYIPIGGSAGSTTNINFNSIDSRVFRATSTTNLVPVESSLYATASHTHSYLPLSGGTLTGAVSSNSNITTTGNVTGAKIIKNGGTNTQLLLANGDTKATGDYNKATYSQTLPSNTSGAYEIGKITIDGTATTLYGKDNNTTYTAESTATNIKMNGTQAVGSLSTYARGDHVHPTDTSRVAVAQGTGNSGKFLKVNSSGNVACESVTIPSAYTHPNSGVTAGTNYNSNQTPAFGATFNIPKLTFDAQGHITASGTSTVKIPAHSHTFTYSGGTLTIN